MRPRISIRGYIRRSVRRSVRNAFVKSGEMKHIQRKKCGETIFRYLYLFLAQGRIVGLWALLLLPSASFSFLARSLASL